MLKNWKANVLKVRIKKWKENVLKVRIKVRIKPLLAGQLIIKE